MKGYQQLETFNTNIFLVIFPSFLTGRSYVSGINQKAKVNACQLLPDRTYRIFLCLVQLVTTTTSMYYWCFFLDIYIATLSTPCMYVLHNRNSGRVLSNEKLSWHLKEWNRPSAEEKEKKGQRKQTGGLLWKIRLKKKKKEQWMMRIKKRIMVAKELGWGRVGIGENVHKMLS